MPSPTPTAAPHPPIDVWLLPRAPANCELRSNYHDVLSDDERETARRITVVEEQRTFVRSRAFLRKLLEAQTGVAAPVWRFGANEHGRPFIALPEQHRGLHFNLSHTRSMTACVLAAQPEIGIDVENAAQPRDFPAIARGFFTPEEAQALAGVAGEEQRRLFYRFWTLKEAYIKAIGTGLSTPLDSFSFTFDPSRGVAFCACEDAHAEEWRFLVTELPDDVCLALAIRAHPDVPVLIRMRRMSATWFKDFGMGERHDLCLAPLTRSAIAHDARD